MLPTSVVSAAPACVSSKKLAFCVAFWYIFASLAVCTSKKITLEVPLPLHLCLVQLVITCITCGVTAAHLGNVRYTDIISSISKESVAAGLLFALGFVFTNMAISCSTVSFAETVKASESVSTLALGFLFYNERASFRTYLTVIPVIVGVILSCYSSDQFIFSCFSYAALSNFCFSGRAVIIKKTKKRSRMVDVGDNVVVEELIRFTEMCLVGSAFVFILCIFSGTASLRQAISLHSTEELKGISALLLLNGCAFSGYNLLSMVVLAQTQLFTHTVLNAVRRVCMIIVSVIYFHNHISPVNMLGITLAAGGALLYSYVKSFAEKNR
jgi:solute carrier family 35 protein E1